MIKLELPFPPTVNHITAVVRGRKITSKRGREFRAEAVEAIQAQHQGMPLSGRLNVTIILMPPTRARRDIDNYSKAVLDALTIARVWVDDEQIDRLVISRGEVEKGGRCFVMVEPVKDRVAA